MPSGEQPVTFENDSPRPIGVSRARHLIVVVPGIGGSVLEAPDGWSAWDLRAGDLARTVIDPENLALGRELGRLG